MSERELVTVAKSTVQPDGRIVNHCTGNVITFAEIEAASRMGMPIDTNYGDEAVHHYANLFLELAERVKSSRAIAAMRQEPKR